MAADAIDDYRRLRQHLGWSRAMARLEQLLTDGAVHSRAEVQGAIDAIWPQLPPDAGCPRCQAAVHRLIAAYRDDRP
jgi:hypothetical protein